MNYRIKEIAIHTEYNKYEPIHLFFPEYEVTKPITSIFSIFWWKKLKTESYWQKVSEYKGKVTPEYDPLYDSIVCCSSIEEAKDIIEQHKKCTLEQKVQAFKKYPDFIFDPHVTTIHPIPPAENDNNLEQKA